MQKNTEDDEYAQHESIPVDLDTDDDYNDNLSNEGNNGSTEQTSDENMDAKQVTKLNNLIIETENITEVSTNNKHLDENRDVKITTRFDETVLVVFSLSTPLHCISVENVIDHKTI